MCRTQNESFIHPLALAEVGTIRYPCDMIIDIKNFNGQKHCLNAQIEHMPSFLRPKDIYLIPLKKSQTNIK